MSLIPHTITALQLNNADSVSTGKNTISSAVVTMLDSNSDVVIMYDDINYTNGATSKVTDSTGLVTVYIEAGNYTESVNGTTRKVNVATTTPVEFTTFAQAQAAKLSKDGQRIIVAERASANYILQASGYVAKTGDLSFSNSRVAALQISDKALSGWFETITDAVSRFNNIKLTENYTVSAPLSLNCAAQDFTIDMNGKTITSDTAGHISAFGSLSYEQSVVSHTTNTITISASNTLTDYLATVIDDKPVIKIVSDDAIDAAEDLTQRRGEFARVLSVVSGVITLESDLYFTYTTAPRVMSLVSGKLTIKNGILDVSDLGIVRGTQMFLTKLNAPLIENVKITKGNDAGIVLRSCYDSVVSKANIHNLKNDAGAGFFGYGVDDSSSHNTLVINGDFSNTRHGYTTNTSSATVGGDAAKFGATMYSKVVNCTGYDNTDDAFDTHPNAYFVTFDGCKGFNNKVALVKDRGKFTTIINPVSNNDAYGVRAASNSDNLKIINPALNNSTTVPMFFSNTNGGSIHIDGGSITTGNSVKLIDAEDCVITGNLNIKYTGSANFATSFTLNSTTVNLSSLTVDYTQSTSTNLRLFEFETGGDNSVKVDRLTIDSVPAANSIAIVTDTSATGTNTAIIKSASLVDFDRLTSSTLAAGSYLISSYNAGSSDVFFVTITANDQFIPELQYNGSHQISMITTVTGSSKNLIALPDGVFIGQILKITLSKNSGFFLTVRQGATYNTDLTTGANTALALGETMSLFWNGTDWEEFKQTN